MQGRSNGPKGAGIYQYIYIDAWAPPRVALYHVSKQVQFDCTDFCMCTSCHRHATQYVKLQDDDPPTAPIKFAFCSARNKHIVLLCPALLIGTRGKQIKSFARHTASLWRCVPLRALKFHAILSSCLNMSDLPPVLPVSGSRCVILEPDLDRHSNDLQLIVIGFDTSYSSLDILRVFLDFFLDCWMLYC